MTLIEQRLARIEAENRKLKFGLVLLLVLAVLIAWQNGNSQRNGKLVAEDLSLVGPDGTEFCGIRMTHFGPNEDNHPTLTLMEGDGGAIMSAKSGGGSFQVAGGPCRVQLMASPTINVADISSVNGKARIELINIHSKQSSPTQRILFADSDGSWRGGMGVGLDWDQPHVMSVDLTNSREKTISLRDDGRIYRGDVELNSGGASSGTAPANSTRGAPNDAGPSRY